jgi:hypothetical protein
MSNHDRVTFWITVSLVSMILCTGLFGASFVAQFRGLFAWAQGLRFLAVAVVFVQYYWMNKEMKNYE